ncbi:tetratricopeptide repeat protein [Chitinophaga sp. sic0106]|uniref:tetratricopeptide repeat protein n=1 Tax=Chitinophaga sp. sic0106 TaxID=2854785 RepID=UPI001C46E982|nr:tetratricopeptide repeat protein [Chitinophaga sp. sic0106]MBV7530497.1 tetratricopeptide repeat protein [Chitinophaga sp. sic0106]
MKLLPILFILCIYINITSAQLNPDSLYQSLSNKNMTSVERINTLNTLAAYYNQDSTNPALVMANEAYLLSLKENDRKLQAASLLNLSEGYLYNDHYDQALNYGYAALDICEALGNDSATARALTNLGWIFYDTENGSFSLQYHQQAHDLYKKLGNPRRIALSLNALGLVYLLKDDFETAGKYFDSTITVAEQSHNNGMVASALGNRGICENEFGRYQKALADFEKALSILSTTDVLAHAELLNQMAFSKIKLKEYPVAEKLLADARELINQSNSNTRKEKILDNLTSSALLYQDLGEYKKAFNALQEYTTVRNQILSKNKSEAISALKIEREAKENERHIITLEAQKELRAFQRNALAAGVILLIIIGALYISKMNQKRKKEKELDEMRQALIKRELEVAIHEKESLNNKLEYRDNDLKNYALFISQRNDMIRNFIDELTVLDIQGEAKPENIARFNRLIHKFQYDLDSNKDTQDFNLSVNEIHKDFFFNLLQKFPDLTENERRLCAQIRLNLSMKDIASLNNISVKSVEMARYRLRKTFQLEHKHNLSDFLQQF